MFDGMADGFDEAKLCGKAERQYFFFYGIHYVSLAEPANATLLHLAQVCWTFFEHF